MGAGEGRGRREGIGEEGEVRMEEACGGDEWEGMWRRGRRGRKEGNGRDG